MKIRRWEVGLVGGILLALGGILLAIPPWHRPPAAWNPLTGPQVLSRSAVVPGLGFRLDPPPSGFKPAVSLERALAIAKSEEDTSRATSIRGVLALFTDPNQRPVTPRGEGSPLIVGVPSWLVTIEGVCVFESGGGVRFGKGGPPPQECGGSEATIVVNATTGEFMGEFSYR